MGILSSGFQGHRFASPAQPLLQYVVNIEADFRFRWVESGISHGTRLMENTNLVPRVILVTAARWKLDDSGKSWENL